VTWYRRHARWDLLRRLLPGVAIGFAAGAVFFVAVGSSSRTLDVVIAVTILAMVAVQIVRTMRRAEPVAPTLAAATGYGAAGGFTTFVSNSAGPVMNTYLVRLGLDKDEMIGTSAWFYFAVNIAKVPLYVALGELSTGGRFFSATSVAYDALLVPAIIVGVCAGRALFSRIDQAAFLWLVLALSAAGAVKLLVR